MQGKAKTRLGQFKEAIFDYGQTLRLRPYFVGVYTGRAQAWIEPCRYCRVLADLQAALELANDGDLIGDIEQKIQELEQE